MELEGTIMFRNSTTVTESISDICVVFVFWLIAGSGRVFGYELVTLKLEGVK
jgi:hypothetical protein